MPYSKRKFMKRTKRRARLTRPVKNFTGLATKKDRYAGKSMRGFYIKTYDKIATAGIPGSTFGVNKVWSTTDLQPGVSDFFDNLAEMYREYKIIGIQVKLFPANIGGDSAVTRLTGALPAVTGVPQLIRGDLATWIAPVGQPQNITNFNDIGTVINFPSCKLHMPRRPIRRWTKRPSGEPEWGVFPTNAGTFQTDPWDGRILMLGTGWSPSTVDVFYCTVTYKILVRGRKY